MEEKCKSGGRTEEIGRKVQKRRKNGGNRRKSVNLTSPRPGLPNHSKQCQACSQGRAG